MKKLTVNYRDGRKITNTYSKNAYIFEWYGYFVIDDPKKDKLDAHNISELDSINLLDYHCREDTHKQDEVKKELDIEDDKIINPTYEELKPLFSDTKQKDVDLDLESIALSNEEYDIINKPKHYNVFEREVIDVIKDLLDNNDNHNGVNAYYIGNVIKYIFRAGMKNDYKQDLEKARYYLNKALEEKE